MKKVLYRDEPFFWRTFKHPSYPYSQSWVRLYRKREGILSVLLPYKEVAKSRGDWDRVKTTAALKKLLTDLAEKEDNKPLLIDCSKEIQELYQD